MLFSIGQTIRKHLASKALQRQFGGRGRTPLTGTRRLCVMLKCLCCYRTRAKARSTPVGLLCVHFPLAGIFAGDENNAEPCMTPLNSNAGRVAEVSQATSFSSFSSTDESTLAADQIGHSLDENCQRGGAPIAFAPILSASHRIHRFSKAARLCGGTALVAIGLIGWILPFIPGVPVLLVGLAVIGSASPRCRDAINCFESRMPTAIRRAIRPGNRRSRNESVAKFFESEN